MKNISIIGLGYVGLPLALALSKNFSVVGFDINKKRIEELNNGFDNNLEFSRNKIKVSKNISFTYKEESLKNSKYFIITVPTPIKNFKPDLSILTNACKIISKYLNKNSVIILESTVYPGITENYCSQIINKYSGLKYMKDYFMAYSPERINPGDKKRTIEKITKIIGASDQKTLRKVKKIYSSFLKEKIFTVKNIQIAEAAKVIENTQRDLNIAFMNELKEIFDASRINIFDVLKAANTKWNFLNFQPGFVGGHCIGVDPYYLAEFAKKNKVKPNVILSGRKTNERVVSLFTLKILDKIKKFSKPNILFLGLTFKENCADIRNSKVLELCEILLSKNINLSVYDPWVSLDDRKNLKIKFLNNLPISSKINLIIISVKHDLFYNIGFKRIKKASSLKNCEVIDVKNIFNKTN